MHIEPFFPALIIGFFLVIPVGPVALLVIKRSSQKGSLSGFLIGLGAALAEMIFSGIAGFGSVFVSGFMRHYESPLGMLGALVMCFFGIKTLREKPHAQKIEPSNKSSLEIVTGFFLAILNPATILVFSAIFVYLHHFHRLLSIGGHFFVLQSMIGFFLGAILWWAIMSNGVSHVKHKVKPESFQLFNTIFGVVMICLGLSMFIKILFL